MHFTIQNILNFSLKIKKKKQKKFIIIMFENIFYIAHN